jgi:hypothetical protein
MIFSTKNYGVVWASVVLLRHIVAGKAKVVLRIVAFANVCYNLCMVKNKQLDDKKVFWRTLGDAGFIWIPVMLTITVILPDPCDGATGFCFGLLIRGFIAVCISTALSLIYTITMAAEYGTRHKRFWILPVLSLIVPIGVPMGFAYLWDALESTGVFFPVVSTQDAMILFGVFYALVWIPVRFLKFRPSKS